MAGEKTNSYHRRSIRLKTYDYFQAGAYFITICTQDHGCLLGEIKDGQMQINASGVIVEQCWHELPSHYPGLELDIFEVMPNHIHGILVLDDERTGYNFRAGLKPAPTGIAFPKPHGLSEIVRGFKTFSARRINRISGSIGVKFWQRGYYERVIRNENELSRIREYIIYNPLSWSLDRENQEWTGQVAIENWLCNST